MTPELAGLIGTLSAEGRLSLEEYQYLIENRDPESAAALAERAVRARKAVYGTDVYIRGLIEISSFCKNDCLYCGLRRSNRDCRRYRLTSEEILSCAAEGYDLGFRTFVLQGGEDAFFTDELLCDLIGELKRSHPDCAVTLSLGERGYESFRRLREAGADRYLLRHETADRAHYAALHPPEMSYDRRMGCLRDLRALGYQVGCGFMVGSPGQSARTLAQDLKFVEDFRPDMCGIGPFIPHHATPFRAEPAGTVELTCYLLSILRLIHPPMLLPATTALGTVDPVGREKGIQAGANVVMPNLSPPEAREKYELYDNKLCTGAESAQRLAELQTRMRSVGYEIAVHRGDIKSFCGQERSAPKERN